MFLSRSPIGWLRYTYKSAMVVNQAHRQREYRKGPNVSQTQRTPAGRPGPFRAIATALGRHRNAEPSGPCCWVATGDMADGPTCDGHNRVIRDTAHVQGRLTLDGWGSPGLGEIGLDRPDSATPTDSEDQRWGR